MYTYMRDYCYIGNGMTPIVCFWVKIIKGEPSSGSAAAVECRAQCCKRLCAHAGKNICSGLAEEGEKKGLILIVIRTIHVQWSRIGNSRRGHGLDTHVEKMLN